MTSRDDGGPRGGPGGRCPDGRPLARHLVVRRDPARRPDLRPRSRARGLVRDRRRAGRWRRARRLRCHGCRLLRHVRAEVAPGAGGNRRPRRGPSRGSGSSRRSAATSRPRHRTGSAASTSGRTPAASRVPESTRPPSRVSPGARGWLAMYVGLAVGARPRGASSPAGCGSPRRDAGRRRRPPPRATMATLVTFAISGLAGPDGRRATVRGESTPSSAPSRAWRRSAFRSASSPPKPSSPAPRCGRGDRAPHARDAAAPSAAGDARRVMTLPPTGRIRSGSGPGPPSAGASSVTRRARSCEPSCPAWSWRSCSRSATWPTTLP